jgi:hypothetical protein
MAGAGGYIWQLAEAAKEYINANLPADLGSKRAGEVAGSAVTSAFAAAGVQGLVQGLEGLGLNGTAGLAANGVADNSSSSIPWWEKEEVDLGMIDRANAEAAAAHWKAWAIADEASPFGAAADDDQQQDGQTPAAAAAAVSTAAAGSTAAAAGLGFGGLKSSRGRWDYTVGLVGKPSAGKSTFYNAVIGE